MKRMKRKNRSGFTLVELMVVILIIAILVGLLAGAAVRVLDKIPEVQTSTDLAQLSIAVQSFMTDYQLSDSPPSLLTLNETVPLSGPNYKFLQAAFGKNLGMKGWVDWNGDGVQNGPWTLEGEQCLIFYIGGIPNNIQMKVSISQGQTPVPYPLGFSSNNMNPATPSGQRKGPYFTFDSTRLIIGPNGFFSYIDAWKAKNSNKPYAFFSSQGIGDTGYKMNGLLDCQSIGALPYWTAQVGAIPSQFSNNRFYQIISAGKDGKFGFNANFPQPNNFWIPTDGSQGTGADDQANFSSTLLGKGQH